MSTLILTLPDSTADAADGYEFVLTRGDGLVVDSGRAGLALMPAATELVALVPAHRLSWQQVRLPRGSVGRGLFRDGGPGRLRAVLDGVLEERVLDDTADLHFALAPDATDEVPVWVAVCDRAWLKAAVAALERAGRPVGRIVPELAPVAADGVLHVTGETNAPRLSAVTPGGVAHWPLSAATLGLLNWPAAQPVLAEPAVAALAEQLMQRAVTLQQAPQRHLQALQGAWDLAQFDLANSGGTRRWRRLSEAATRLARAPRWRPARWALLATLLVNLVGLNAWAWKEQSALKAQRQAIREVLTGTFVKVQVVVDAPVQMARELSALQRASGQTSGRDLEAMLAAFAAVGPAQAVPEAIDYVAGELRLKGLALRPDELAALSLRLKAGGYVAQADTNGVLIRQGSER
jgi:general secretion pathway protein L